MRGQQNSPIFIFGTARSGTSLVSRIINGHPEIGIPYESLFYPTFYGWREYYGDLGEAENCRRLIMDVLSFDAIQRWRPVPSIDEIMNNCEEFSFNGVLEGLVRAWLKTQGKQRWGEKTPHHAYYWKELLSGFPDMKVIHIVRDGRDVALSWKKARFGPRHVYPIAKKWVDYLQTIEEMRLTLPKEQFHQIHYEDLLEDPMFIVQGICRFLRVEYNKGMLRYYESQASYPTDATNFQNLSKPVMRKNTQKWVSQMEKDELRIFESAAGDYLEKYGYTLSSSAKPLSNIEANTIRFFIHPPRRLWGMVKNKRGYIELGQKLRIYSRLILTRRAKKKKSENFFYQ